MTLSYEQGLIEAHRQMSILSVFNGRAEFIGFRLPCAPRPSVEPKDTDTEEEG